MAKVDYDGVKPDDSASACGEPSGVPRDFGEVPLAAAEGERQAAAVSDLLSVVGRRTKARRSYCPRVVNKIYMMETTRQWHFSVRQSSQPFSRSTILSVHYLKL